VVALVVAGGLVPVQLRKFASASFSALFVWDVCGERKTNQIAVNIGCIVVVVVVGGAVSEQGYLSLG
jgi:hypothetical protein